MATPRRPRRSRGPVESAPLREGYYVPRRRLFTTEKPRDEFWSQEEVKALVEFVLFHGQGKTWPCHKREVFWKAAGSFVQVRSKSVRERTGI